MITLLFSSKKHFLNSNWDLLLLFLKKKPQTLLTGGPKRVPSRNPYQSIDLIECYKSHNKHKELERGRQTLEGAKVYFFLIDFLQFLRSFLTNSGILKYEGLKPFL